MVASILGNLVSDIFRKAVRTMLALTFIGVCLLGVGFATGTIRPDDLRPENVRNLVATCRERVSTLTGLAGDLSKVDGSGAIESLGGSQQNLRNLGTLESPYGGGDLRGGYRSEVSDDDDPVLAGNY